MTLELRREVLEATFSELTHLLVIPARLTLEKAELGIGGFGQVCLATLDKSSRSPRKVAVKQLLITQASFNRERIAIRLARELKIWAKVQHPNILELIGYYLSEDYLCAQFVSAFMVNGNVMQYIQRSHVSVAIRLKFVRDIATGLNYLHDFNPPICHGDLKPANVLVNESLDAVLCDFGVSSVLHESGAASGLTTTKSARGSVRYMSPELILENDSKHTLQSDVWAWGCTAFEVMTGSVPYSTRQYDPAVLVEMCNKSAPGSIDALNAVILGTGIDPACHAGLSALRSIIPPCWDFDPTQRPPSSRILQYIAIPSKSKPSFGGQNDQEAGILFLRTADDSRQWGGASQKDVAPDRAHSLCKNCQQYPKVGGQDFCSKACLESDLSNVGKLSAASEHSPEHYLFPSLDPGPSDINGGNAVGRSRRSTQGKNKKGMFSFMSGVSSHFLTTAKRPEISIPSNPVHLKHVGFNSNTGEFTGLPNEWQQTLQESRISRQDQEKKPQTMVEIFKFYQETVLGPGKISDENMATGSVAGVVSDLETYDSDEERLPLPPTSPPAARKRSSSLRRTFKPQPYRPVPSAPVPSAAAVALDRSAFTHSLVPPQPTQQGLNSKTNGGSSHKARFATPQGEYDGSHWRERTTRVGVPTAPMRTTIPLPLNRESKRGEERELDRGKARPPRERQKQQLSVPSPSVISRGANHAPQPPRHPLTVISDYSIEEVEEATNVPLPLTRESKRGEEREVDRGKANPRRERQKQQPPSVISRGANHAPQTPRHPLTVISDYIVEEVEDATNVPLPLDREDRGKARPRRERQKQQLSVASPRVILMGANHATQAPRYPLTVISDSSSEEAEDAAKGSRTAPM